MGRAHRRRYLLAPGKARIVVSPDRDHGAIGETFLLQGGYEGGQRRIKEVHGVEKVPKIRAAPVTDIEFFEVGGEAIEGMVQREGQEIGRERSVRCRQPVHHLAQKVAV
jgi:hypothetical protein